MKKILLTVFVLFSISAIGQSVVPPHSVQDAFKQSHPDAYRLMWSNDNGNFKATYYQNKKQVNTVYDANAVVLRNEYELSASEIPSGVSEYLTSSKAPADQTKVFMIVNQDGSKSYYTVVNQEVKLFDQDGKVK